MHLLTDVNFPIADWAPTKETLHRYLQIVGKLRLAVSPRRNHWWNVPFHVTASGVTTRPMGTDPVFAVDFDFIDHRLIVATNQGTRSSFSLQRRSVADFHSSLVHAMLAVGADPFPIMMASPFDLPDHTRPFRADNEHHSYDPSAAATYWRVLAEVNMLLEEFSGRYSGKTSPVHHFWHTFDIAATRFSDAIVDHGADVDPVTREAYSREVMSSGFWFGDPETPEPAFYAYTSPEPDGLASQPIPAGSTWRPRGGEHLAVYPLREAQRTGDVRAAVMHFWESAYRAGAELAGWDIERLSCPGGVTDSLLRRSDALIAPFRASRS